jgi:hypothetical protein
MSASPQVAARRIQFQPMRAVTVVAKPVRIDLPPVAGDYWEGVPRSLIKAATCALPMVTTDHPGCREVVTDGVEGLLAPVRDAGALAAAIRCLLHAHPEWARQLGRAARAKALAEFDERIVIERTLAVYQELLPELKSGDAARHRGEW